MGDNNKQELPQAPETQSYSEVLQDFIANRPELTQSDIQASQSLSQAQLDLIKQFAAPTGLALRSAQEEINPELAKLQKDLVGQVTQGLTGELPDILKDQYLSDIRANLGTNVGSPIGATALARELFGLGESRRQSFINPALSLLGKYTTPQATIPGIDTTGTTTSPSTALSYASQQANQLANIYGTQASLYANQPSDPFSQILGTFTGAATGALGTSAGAGISSTAASMLPFLFAV